MAVLSLAYIATSALDNRSPNQTNAGIDQLGESLLHTRPECYDHFEDVLVRFWFLSITFNIKINKFLKISLKSNDCKLAISLLFEVMVHAREIFRNIIILAYNLKTKIETRKL